MMSDLKKLQIYISNLFLCCLLLFPRFQHFVPCCLQCPHFRCLLRNASVLQCLQQQFSLYLTVTLYNYNIPVSELLLLSQSSPSPVSPSLLPPRELASPLNKKTSVITEEAVAVYTFLPSFSLCLFSLQPLSISLAQLRGLFLCTHIQELKKKWMDLPLFRLQR